jgi:hypothetical protein
VGANVTVSVRTEVSNSAPIALISFAAPNITSISSAEGCASLSPTRLVDCPRTSPPQSIAITLSGRNFGTLTTPDIMGPDVLLGSLHLAGSTEFLKSASDSHVAFYLPQSWGRDLSVGVSFYFFVVLNFVFETSGSNWVDA